MATQSFYEDMVLKTPEAVRNLERAIEAADRRGPLKIEGIKGVTNDPEIARRIAEMYEK
ncbi:hypothetical protein TALC_00941 [Thermoplasmatales archaeon BRNA1]|nr:hypothetical protein TALC_00941 [Thermoplasmatales archaeon BRNA1]